MLGFRGVNDGAIGMSIQDKVRSLRLDADVLTELARLQKNSGDRESLLRQSRSLLAQAEALEGTTLFDSSCVEPSSQLHMCD